MKIVIANDHNGVYIKNKLIEYLKKNNFQIDDLGSQLDESVDYPNYAFQLGKAISKKDYDFGILICGTGIGMSIACNKVRGIRCAKVSSVREAKLSRQHNNANVIALSSKMPLWKMKKIISMFITTPFSNEERHIRRNDLIDNYYD